MSNFGIKNIWKNTNSGSSVDTTNLVTTNTNQIITGDKEFNANTQFNKVVEFHNGTTNDCSLAIHREINRANWVGFYNGNTRLAAIGKSGANDTWLTLMCDTGNIKFSCPTNSSIDVNSHKIINVSNPVNANDAVNKNYVDTKYSYGNKIEMGTTNITPNSGNWRHWTKSYSNDVISVGTNHFLLKFNYNGADYTKEFTIGVNSTSYPNITDVMTFKLLPNNAGDDDVSHNTLDVMLIIKARQIIWYFNSSGLSINTNFFLFRTFVEPGTFS